MSDPSQPSAEDGDGPRPKDEEGGAESGKGRQAGRAVAKGVGDAFAPLLRFIEAIGGHVVLAVRSLAWLPRRPYRIGNYLEAGEYIGFGSLPIVVLVGAFTGMVTSLQSVFAFRTFGLEAFAGGTTAKALSTELGPVLTSLMLAGRAGAGIATELGTMRISEQIDALESMAINPKQFLILPRIMAGLVMAPILVLIFFLVGMAGAYFVAVVAQGVDKGQFIFYTKEFIDMLDVTQGLIKGMIFGFVVILIGCYQGFHAKGGGRGVGIGTTRAVVSGSVSVLVLDYFVTEIFFSIFPQVR